MKIEIVTTPTFRNNIEPLLSIYPNIKDELIALHDALLANPNAGKKVFGTQNGFRVAIKKRGVQDGLVITTRVYFKIKEKGGEITKVYLADIEDEKQLN
ncbi:MAG: hypothetical protein Kapaf2KO_20120 [Candidatus Kapaibacteriales bacterium]